MKNIPHAFIILISLFLLNSCSTDDDITCPKNENVSMKINGEELQFQVQGRGIDLDREDHGHTLFLAVVTGDFSPAQDSYSIVIKLPYKATGNNIIEEFYYHRVENLSTVEGYFVPGNLQSNVTVNTKNCFSATFSGSAVIDGNEISISEGFIIHSYEYPFDNW